jgi:hypothetical protein
VRQLLIVKWLLFKDGGNYVLEMRRIGKIGKEGRNEYWYVLL